QAKGLKLRDRVLYCSFVKSKPNALFRLGPCVNDFMRGFDRWRTDLSCRPKPLRRHRDQTLQA
ncbi:MAG: hypothetical protein ABW172_19175, partial [Candidatus Binatia bacterium]